jgi:C-terminal processing protease CtpA/Prc
MMNGFLFYYSEFIGQPLWFRLKLKAPNDELPKFVSVPALTLKEIHRFSLRRTTRPSLALNTKPLQFQITDENVAILTIRSFDDRDFLHAKQHFHAFIRKSFESMKQHGVTDLVLDIRENGGGDDYNARFLYSYLTDSTFRYYDRVEIAGNTKISFLNHTNKPLLLRFFRFFVKPDPAASGRYLWVHSPLSQAHDPRSSTYTGSVFILINGESFSATSEFAAIASYHKRALFMGEETGGCYEGDNSGLEMILTLPHTHIRVRIPMMKYVLAVGSHTPAGRGIMPDYTILPSVKDLLDGIDTEKEFTLDLIRKKNCKGCGR